MRGRDINAQKFNKGQWEIIAGQFREALGPLLRSHDVKITLRRRAIVDMALSFAHRLQSDNVNFDPVIFLDRCSPDPEHYPISELWEESDQYSRKV